MKPSKRSQFQHLLCDLEEKQTEEKIKLFPPTPEKQALKDAVLFGNQSHYADLYETLTNQVYDLCQELIAVLAVHPDDFEKLPHPKKVKLQSIVSKASQIRNKVLDLNDVNACIKLEYEANIKKSLFTLLQNFS
jgi:hypothetical protein